MKIPSYTSDKIRILSLISMILVLYIHSGFHLTEIQEFSYNDYIQKFISGILGRCAVPLFFIISGFLFFQGNPTKFGDFKSKIKKRFHTLLIPYVVGCLFFVLFFYLLDLVPGTGKFMNGSIVPKIEEQNLSSNLLAIFYNAGNGTPFAFQLWFLRDLTITVLLSPLLIWE